MSKFLNRLFLIFGIFLTLMCTISFFIEGGLRKWDAEICLYLIIYSFCTNFLIFILIWIAGMMIIFFGIIFIKCEL